MNAEGIREARVLVRSRLTRAYAGEGEDWTSDVANARPFENAYHALYFCVSQDVEGADIVERFPDGREVRFLQC